MIKPSSPSLLQHLGVTLVERALFEAVFRHHATSLWQLVGEDLLGINLGEPSPDLALLRATAAVLTGKCRDGFGFSLDGNEQFGSAEQLHDLGRRVMSDPVLTAFFAHLLFIEQPITRRAALKEDAGFKSTFRELNLRNIPCLWQNI